MNAKRGLFRVYVALWGLWAVLCAVVGVSMLVNAPPQTVGWAAVLGAVAIFAVVTLLLPAGLVVLLRWIGAGFKTPDNSPSPAIPNSVAEPLPDQTQKGDSKTEDKDPDVYLEVGLEIVEGFVSKVFENIDTDERTGEISSEEAARLRNTARGGLMEIYAKYSGSDDQTASEQGGPQITDETLLRLLGGGSAAWDRQMYKALGDFIRGLKFFKELDRREQAGSITANEAHEYREFARRQVPPEFWHPIDGGKP